MAIRQRRGYNRWTEPQEFAASGVAVDVPNGRIKVGNKFQIKYYYGITPAACLRDGDDSNFYDLICKRLVTRGNVTLRGGGQINTTSDGNIQLKPDTGGITKVGNANTTSHGLNTNDDLFVTGQLEVSGNAHFSSSVNMHGGQVQQCRLWLTDGKEISWGSDNDCQFEWNDTAGLVDCTTGGGGPLALPAPTAAPTLQTDSTMTLSVDETNDELDVTVKYSDGSVHTGTVTLV